MAENYLLSALVQKRTIAAAVGLSARCQKATSHLQQNSSHFHGTHVPMEEPSTASEADTRAVTRTAS